jgi:hypothetical protein
MDLTQFYRKPNHMDENDIQIILRSVSYDPLTGEMTRLDASGHDVDKRKGTHMMVEGKLYPRSKIAWVATFKSVPPKRLFFRDGDNKNFKLANITTSKKVVRKKRKQLNDGTK